MRLIFLFVKSVSRSFLLDSFARRNRFFQILGLGEYIPEIDDGYATEEEMFAKINEGIAEYKAGKTKTLDPRY